MKSWSAIIQSIFGILKPILGPMLAYFKGRSEGKAIEKAKSNEEYIRRVDAGIDARSGKLPDERTDPANRG